MVRVILFVCIFIFPITGCVYGPDKTSGRVVVQGDHGVVDLSFGDRDREIIHDYYYGQTHKKQKKGVPPGLAKKGGLPPGLQKQLVKRGQLPPGLQYQSLPHDLEKRLSRIPDDYARVMIEGSFVLFDKRTNVIFDVINDL